MELDALRCHSDEKEKMEASCKYDETSECGNVCKEEIEKETEECIPMYWHYGSVYFMSRTGKGKQRNSPIHGQGGIRYVLPVMWKLWTSTSRIAIVHSAPAEGRRTKNKMQKRICGRKQERNTVEKRERLWQSELPDKFHVQQVCSSSHVRVAESDLRNSWIPWHSSRRDSPYWAAHFIGSLCHRRRSPGRSRK